MDGGRHSLEPAPVSVGSGENKNGTDPLSSSQEVRMSAHLPTPIPVGSPHLAEMPTFDRWGLVSRRGRLDKRDYDRRDIKCDLWMLDVSAQSVLRCKTDDISDAGLHATAPVGFGLAVGQRYEVRIAHTETAKGSAHLAAPLGYATVIRTEFHLDSERQDRVGFAVRFDAPQLIPV
jgi:hypothetical protein